MKTLCLIEEMGMHYREPIYKKMGEELKCDFYFSDRETSVKHFDYNGFKSLKGIFRKINICGPVSFSPGILRLLFKYDNIIVDGLPYDVSQWILCLCNLLARKKIYAWTHGYYGREGLFKRIVKRIFFSMFYKIFTYGNYARDLMIERGYPPEKIAVIYNSLDYEKQKHFRESAMRGVYKRHFGNDNPTIIYIGRLSKHKRVDMVIKAVACAKNIGENINAAIVGRLNDDEFPNLAKAEGVEDRIWFYGESYDERANAELLKNAALCVSPGHIGLTALHAATYGCPSITHDNFSNQAPEFEIIKKGVSGDFFKENDLNDMVQTILRWTKISEEQRQQVSAECIKTVEERWNPDNQMEILKRNIDL